jgi:hypothetical protein
VKLPSLSSDDARLDQVGALAAQERSTRVCPAARVPSRRRVPTPTHYVPAELSPEEGAARVDQQSAAVETARRELALAGLQSVLDSVPVETLEAVFTGSKPRRELADRLPASVETLAALLGSSPVLASAAADRLGDMEHGAVAALLPVLASERPVEVRQAAAAALQRVATAEDREALLALLDGIADADQARPVAQLVVSLLGDAAGPELVSRARDEKRSPSVREVLVSAVAGIRRFDATTGADVLAILADGCPEVRRGATLALAYRGTDPLHRKYAQTLTTVASRDMDATVRRDAAQVIGTLCDASVLPRLYEAVTLERDEQARQGLDSSIALLEGKAP